MGVDLKLPPILDSNSCGVLAFKRLITHAASFSSAAFEKKPRQREVLAVAATLQAGAGERSVKDSGDSSRFLPKLFSGHQGRERKRLVSESQKGNFAAPLRTHTPRPAVTPIQMPHPHCKSQEGSAPATRAQPPRPSSSSPVYSTPTFPVLRTPRFPARTSVPAKGPERAERAQVGTKGV